LFDDFSYKYASAAEGEYIVRVVEGVHVYLSTSKTSRGIKNSRSRFLTSSHLTLLAF
jgi:hypothetical protein